MSSTLLLLAVIKAWLAKLQEYRHALQDEIYQRWEKGVASQLQRALQEEQADPLRNNECAGVGGVPNEQPSFSDDSLSLISKQCDNVGAISSELSKTSAEDSDALSQHSLDLSWRHIEGIRDLTSNVGDQLALPLPRFGKLLDEAREHYYQLLELTVSSHKVVSSLVAEGKRNENDDEQNDDEQNDDEQDDDSQLGSPTQSSGHGDAHDISSSSAAIATSTTAVPGDPQPTKRSTKVKRRSKNQRLVARRRERKYLETRLKCSEAGEEAARMLDEMKNQVLYEAERVKKYLHDFGDQAGAENTLSLVKARKAQFDRMIANTGVLPRTHTFEEPA